MKKIVAFISILAVVVGLFLAVFNYSGSYDFVAKFKEACNQNYNNPLSHFNDIINSFKNFDNLNYSSAWYDQIFGAIKAFFNLLWSLIKAPCEMLYDCAIDLYLLMRAFLIILGLA